MISKTLALAAICLGTLQAKEGWYHLPAASIPIDSTQAILEGMDPNGYPLFTGEGKIVRLRDGVFTRIEVPGRPGARLFQPMTGADGALWVKEYAGNAKLLHRLKDGKATTFDSANSCIRGNSINILGVDAQGAAVVDMAHFGGMVGESYGLKRVSASGCTDIAFEKKTTYTHATAYFRDKRGTEYIATQEFSDVIECFGLTRLGSASKRFLTTTAGRGHCVTGIDERAGSILVGTYDAGLAVITGDSERWITAVNGMRIPAILSVFVDSRSDAWIGMELIMDAPSPMLVRIEGKDTVEAGADGRGNARYAAEDAEGNIWVRCSYSGTWAWLRDDSRKPVSLARHPGIHVSPAEHSEAGAYDIRGRNTHRQQRARSQLFPLRAAGN